MPARVCSACGSSKLKAGFSKKQWKAGDGRRCKVCTSGGVSAAPPTPAVVDAAPPAAPTIPTTAAVAEASAPTESPPEDPVPATEPVVAAAAAPAVVVAAAPAAAPAAASSATADALAVLRARMESEHAETMERVNAAHSAEIAALRNAHAEALERSARAVRAIVKADEARRRDRGLTELLRTVGELEKR